MGKAMGSNAVQLFGSIGEVSADDWDYCVAGRNPFAMHGHLRALEESGSVSPESGFTPSHLLLRDASGRPAGAAAVYLKTNSMFESGIDLGFEIAHERIGGSYYPKVYVEAPLTYTRGPCLLVPPGPNGDATRLRLLDELKALAERVGAASVHIAQVEAEEAALLTDAGMVPGHGICFVWRNRGYREFEDFIVTLKADRRKTLRRERRKIRNSGLNIVWTPAEDLSPGQTLQIANLFDRNFEKYKSDNGYKDAYFQKLGERLPGRVFYALAYSGDEIIAACNYFLANDGLFSIQWGCSQAHRFLHFEIAYYIGMDQAIARGLSFMNAGNFGAHKASRGCLPEASHHAFWFRNPEFNEIARIGLGRKSAAADREAASQMERSPFLSDQPGERLTA